LVLGVLAVASTLDKQSVYNYMSHLALSNEIVHNVCTDACVKLLNPCPDCATEQIHCIANICAMFSVRTLVDLQGIWTGLEIVVHVPGVLQYSIKYCMRSDMPRACSIV